jgi:alpha-D-ribose 1-methylphosphonate 5-triphosphate diphosphatase PhnM
MRTLAEDGWRLVAAGVTTVAEVLSVTTSKEVESVMRKPAAETAAPAAVVAK